MYQRDTVLDNTGNGQEVFKNNMINQISGIKLDIAFILVQCRVFEFERLSLKFCFVIPSAQVGNLLIG